MSKDSERKAVNRTEFLRPRHVAGLELVSASYERLSFPSHAHQEFVVGAITAGAERLVVGRRSAVLSAGDTLFLHPGEIHANATMGESPLRYRVFYIPEELLRETLRIEDASLGVPCFAAPFSSSAKHYDLLVRSHAALRSSYDALTQQSAFVGLAAGLARGFRDGPLRVERTDNAKVRIALIYLREHFRANPSLSMLSEVAGLSPYHLLRTFKRQVGLSPVAYRNLLRVLAAKDALRRGESLAAAAIDAGFSDQSHMTRAFQKVMGATPGRYARQ